MLDRQGSECYYMTVAKAARKQSIHSHLSAIGRLGLFELYTCVYS